jgi:hypothetical protein
VLSPVTTTISYLVADLKKGLNSLYMYCPLVESRMVGDAQVPLLRIVPVEGRDGEMITRVFDPIQCCPLIQRRFQTVNMYIRDDTGSIVPLERVRVVVTLHWMYKCHSYPKCHSMCSAAWSADVWSFFAWQVLLYLVVLWSYRVHSFLE